MQIVDEERVVEVCKDDDHHNMMQQIISKGKRTKRQRLPSPLSIAIALPSSSAPGLFDLPTITTTKVTAMAMAPNEFRRTEEEENDEDMANCLILLAQGHYPNNKASKSSLLASPNSNNKVAASSSGLYNLYECKTCNRCFPSFQALGGHRASHKKPKTNNNNNNNCIISIAQDHHHHHHEKQGGVTSSTTSSFVNGDIDHNNNNYVPTTSTTLTLQIPNRGSFNSSRNTVSTTPTPKSKVHECSICGAEFASGQALGGHMRRHRAFLSMSSATTTPSSSMSLHESSPQEGKTVVPKNVLKLDLNLPAAPEDDHHRESNNNNKFAFQSKEKVIVFSTATSLVDCQY